MPDWTSGEDRRLAEWRDEYRRGPHRKLAPLPSKPPQRGPSLPAPTPEETPMCEECQEGQHRQCAQRTVDGWPCGCACRDDDEELPL